MHEDWRYVSRQLLVPNGPGEVERALEVVDRGRRIPLGEQEPPLEHTDLGDERSESDRRGCLPGGVESLPRRGPLPQVERCGHVVELRPDPLDIPRALRVGRVQGGGGHPLSTRVERVELFDSGQRPPGAGGVRVREGVDEGRQPASGTRQAP